MDDSSMKSLLGNGMQLMHTQYAYSGHRKTNTTMPKAQRLKAEDRKFFGLLADLIFSNPFSTQRAQMEAMLDGASKSARQSGEHHYSVILPVLERRLAKLAEHGIDRIQSLGGNDRSVLEYAFLFRIYNRFIENFDALIQAQIEQGDQSVEVPFARELLAQLDAAGFGEQEALRYLELFYQFRRAYFFIAHSLVGDSPSMKSLRHALWNNVFTSDVRFYAAHLWDRMEDFSTLLLGETGTGKGSAAAAIGRSGLIPFDPGTKRFKFSFTETFIAINLSEFPESLIESELFGHRKGAFTGAIDHHKGLFERCNPHGSLFLDEIGDVSVPTQIKLLNVLQERRFTPVGSHQPLRFAGRVIAATNQPLAVLREQGQFRDDFYYRLSSDVIEVPSLRVRLKESTSELEQLVVLLVKRLTGHHEPELVERVLDGLHDNLQVAYPWPGNVRELEQAVRRIIISGQYFGVSNMQDAASSWLERTQNGQLTAEEILSGYCCMLYEQYGTYEEVARRAALDRRTAKKHVQMGKSLFETLKT